MLANSTAFLCGFSMAFVVQTLSERIFSLVREQILAGKIAPHSAIRQDALAAELGVSKIPLREAFARLEQEGLLVSHANRGFFVRPMSAAEAEEVYALRLKLEPDAVALAAERATAEDQQAAREAFAEIGRAIDAHGVDVGICNRAFHLALVRPAGQPLTTQLLERLHILSERYVAKHLEPEGRDTHANAEHALMLDTWLERRREDVRELAHNHIVETLADLRKQFDF